MWLRILGTKDLINKASFCKKFECKNDPVEFSKLHFRETAEKEEAGTSFPIKIKALFQTYSFWELSLFPPLLWGDMSQKGPKTKMSEEDDDDELVLEFWREFGMKCVIELSLDLD